VNELIVYQCFISEDVVDCDTSLESASDFEEPEDGELQAEIYSWTRVTFVARASLTVVDFLIELPVEKQLQNIFAQKLF